MKSLKCRGLIIIGLLVLSYGCAAGPRPVQLIGTSDFNPCLDLFSPGPWEVVHRIEAVFKAGRRASLIGVTKAHDSSGHLQSVLMTPEGMVLLNVSRRAGRIEVKRALPPFDSPDFAAGMLADVELMLAIPAGRPLESGLSTDGRPACRWSMADGGIEEVSLGEDGAWVRRRYDSKGRLAREVAADPPMRDGFASRTILQASGTAGYRLTVDLLEVYR